MHDAWNEFLYCATEAREWMGLRGGDELFQPRIGMEICLRM
jgi:hypothetical protein